MLDRWKKAVVHLEGAADSHSIEEMDRITLDLEEGRITQEQADQTMMAGMRDRRFQGTALYVQMGQKCFLVTARHVVHDVVGGERSKEDLLKRVGSLPADMHALIQKQAEDLSQDSMFRIIFRVLPFDELARNGMPSMASNPGRFLMNLGAGSPFGRPYSYTGADLDLAVISLHEELGRGNRFKEDLDDNGYVPVDFSDIADGPTTEGADIFTVGFPQATATIGTMELDPGTQAWASKYISVPVFAFGKVAMLHKDMPKFWGDISIYPGNSGGPVVESDKLVGIVSGNATIPSEDLRSRMRIPFASLIKGKYVRELIVSQVEKEERAKASHSMPE